MTTEAETHLPLAPRDLLILAVLAEGPLHGYGIIKAVEARSQSGVLLDPANLYRVLRRMRRLGWIGEVFPGGDVVDSGNVPAPECGSAEPSGLDGRSPEGIKRRPRETFEEATPQTSSNGDPRRRTYQITSHGKSLLAAELARLQRLLDHARPALADGEGA